MTDFIKVVLLLNAGVAALLAGFNYWAGELAVKILSGLFVAFFVYAIWRGAHNFGLHRSVFGQPKQGFLLPDWEQRKLYGQLRAYAEKSEDWLIGTVVSYSTIILIAGLVVQPWWIPISLFLLGLASPYANRRAYPGFALVLGRSNDPTTKNVGLAVMRAAAPFNVTHLLNFLTHDEVASNIEELVGVRITNEIVSWKAAVEAHALLAKVVVLDVSSYTAAVIEEIKVLESHSLWYKTIAYCSDTPAETQRRLEQYTQGALDVCIATSLPDLRRLVSSSAANYLHRSAL